jgi:NADH:ubiquinone oxidoreductase subunit
VSRKENADRTARWLVYQNVSTALAVMHPESFSGWMSDSAMMRLLRKLK